MCATNTTLTQRISHELLYTVEHKIIIIHCGYLVCGRQFVTLLGHAASMRCPTADATMACTGDTLKYYTSQLYHNTCGTYSHFAPFLKSPLPRLAF